MTNWRQRRHGVGIKVDETLDWPTIKAGKHTEHHADPQRDRRRDADDGKRRASAIKDTGQNAAPERVGTEKTVEGPVRILRKVAIGKVGPNEARNEIGENCRKDQCSKECDGEPIERVAARKAQPCSARHRGIEHVGIPGRNPIRRGLQPGIVGTHDTSTRGSTSA